MSKLVVYAILVVSVVVPAIAPGGARAESTKAGVVTTLEGQVTVTRITLPPQPLKLRDEVFVNDTVTTAERSLARMLLGGKAVVTVRERSALTITEGPGKASIDLAAGKIALAVARDKMRPGESIEIRAANAVAGIRGTVVVAEVSSIGGAVGTFWVLKGRIEAYLANRPGTIAVVDSLQQFRGGTVTNIRPDQMGRILHGLSSGRVPPTADQAPEAGYSAGLELARASAAIVAAPAVIVPVPMFRPTVPILPGNRTITPAPPAPGTSAPAVTPPPPPPPVKVCDRCKPSSQSIR